MILFDLSYFAHRIVHPNKGAILENNNFFAHLITNQILAFSKKLGASKQNRMVLCLDSPSWRRDFYEDHKPKCPEYDGQVYKGNRKKDSELPWDFINSTIDIICDSLKENSDFYVVKVDKAEADDIIAVLAKRYKDYESIWIGSSDKDFIQLQEHDRVEIFDPLKNCFKPEQDIALYKKIHNIIGDTSDNILAIKPRVGDKTAIKMIKDLPNLLATDPLMKEKYKFNRNLIDFDYIPVYIEDAILNEFAKQSFTYNPTGLLKTFMKYGMSKLLEDVASFKLSENEIKTPTNQYFLDSKKNAEMSRCTLEDFFD